MNTTVKQAREALEAARMNYYSCEPSEVVTAKSAMDSATNQYLAACSDFCTKLEFSTDLAEVHENLITQGLWE